jgi:hypothetical protein
MISRDLIEGLVAVPSHSKPRMSLNSSPISHGILASLDGMMLKIASTFMRFDFSPNGLPVIYPVFEGQDRFVPKEDT